MPDIEAIAERVTTPPWPEPTPVDHWILLEWRDEPSRLDGGFWFAGMLWMTRDEAIAMTIKDPRRERIVHIVEPRG